MKELKNKKTGAIAIITEEEYAAIVNKKPDFLKKYIITDMRVRNIIPAQKQEDKQKTKK